MIDNQRLVSGALDEVPALLREWSSHSPETGILALVPEAEKDKVKALQALCREAGSPLIGAIFPSLIVDEAFTSQGIWLLHFPRMPQHFLLEDMNDAPFEAGRRLSEAVRKIEQKSEHSPIFMFFDGMLPNIGSILINMHANLQTQPHVCGANAGSETFQPMPCLFNQERLIGNGVLGFLLPENARTAVQHGYPVARTIMRATSTVGNRIDQIDGRPAMTVYQEVIQAEFGVTLTHQNFYDYAVHFPFGVVTALDVLVRIPVAFGEDGSIFCVGEVPPNSVLRLLRAPALVDSNCVDKLVVDLGRGRQAGDQAMLAFYCAGRRMHFGDAAAQELAHLKQLSGTRLLVGALTLGEIDSLHDLRIPRFHNATVVCVS